MRVALRSATVFCLGAEPPASVPVRATPEYLDSAWLVHGETRHHCLVRKLGAAGATLQLLAPVAAGDRFALHIDSGPLLDGAIGWADAGEAGFLFDQRIDIVGALARNLAGLPADRRSVPRVELDQAVSVRRDARVQFARARDLSQAGVGLQLGFELFEDEAVEVAFDGLRPVPGRVRWVRQGHAGIAFDTELAWQVLMPWLRQIQDRPSRIDVASPADMQDLEPGFGLNTDKTALHLNAAGTARQGTRWWNIRVRSLNALMVEFETDAPMAMATPLWILLGGTTGWPATVTEARGSRYLAEFRVPLRQHELDRIAARSI
ncbi:PilZ domain-containing protein [Sphingomonas sp. HF-S3]|uniref:PilZ domain-containing protein n=1 Tax=Sphingomonas rustica TaxID=3103142 RepID=A0ABV0B7C6_9SPHN